MLWEILCRVDSSSFTVPIGDYGSCVVMPLVFILTIYIIRGLKVIIKNNCVLGVDYLLQWKLMRF